MLGVLGHAKDKSIKDIIKNLSRKDIGVSKYHIYGEAKFEFVAINHNGTIATYHTQAGSKMYSNIKHGKNNFEVEKLSCKMM